MTNVNGSKWIRPEKRLAIYLRDGFVCLVCGKDLHAGPHSELTLDHVNPRLVDQGNNDERNIYTTCLSCNSKRQSAPLSSFASPEAIKNIWQHVSKDLAPYHELSNTLSSVPEREREHVGSTPASAQQGTKNASPQAAPSPPPPPLAATPAQPKAPSRYVP